MAYVLYDETLGVYLGGCMGLGFWSKLDPAGQDAAVTFPSARDAEEHKASWDDPIPSAQPIPVEPDIAFGYASIEACKKVGLPGWQV